MAETQRVSLGRKGVSFTLRKGALHRELGISEDETIPVSMLRAKAKGEGRVARMARSALGLRAMNPWHVEERDGKFAVVKNDTGEVVGTHPTREAAERQVAALYANEGYGKAEAKRRTAKASKPDRSAGPDNGSPVRYA